VAAVLVGVMLCALYALGVEPVASWSWGWLLLPFGLAVVWWEWSDFSGRTRRLQEERMSQRVQDRRAKAFEALQRPGSRKSRR
jgi:small Trp-rich protein